MKERGSLSKQQKSSPGFLAVGTKRKGMTLERLNVPLTKNHELQLVWLRNVNLSCVFLLTRKKKKPVAFVRWLEASSTGK